MANLSLADLCEQAGASPHVEYLRARGIATVSILARTAASEADFIQNVVTPYIDGTTVLEVPYKAAGDQLGVKAALVVAWEDARAYRDRHLAVAASAPPSRSSSRSTGACAAPGRECSTPAR